MAKTGKRLAAVFLAVAMVMTFMPVFGDMTGGEIGVQTVHALSAYTPSINVERNSIRLRISNPYAGTHPGNISSWTKVLDEANGTKITVMDMWIDAENGPMDDDSMFVEGKSYTYQAYITSVTDSGTAPDLTHWDFAVGKVDSDDDIKWPDGSEVTCDKTESTILYTAKFTARNAQSRDKGTYELDLANGKKKITDEDVDNALFAISYEYPSMHKSPEESWVDLDNDGAYDLKVLFGDDGNCIECGKLTTTKIKNQITVKIPDVAKTYYDNNDLDYYGTLTIKFDKLTNPLTMEPKTATVKYSKLKKKAQTLAVTKVINFKKDAKDKKNYTLSSAKKGSKSFKSKFKINKSTGKVTVKKGLKKGTYKVKVKVKALGNENYKPITKPVTFKVKVK